MKKLLPFLIAFIFSLSINAQSPTLNVTNVTGSNSITCTYPSINYQASVSNYTAGPLTYTWVSLSGTASGTNVTFSNPASYTVIAFNTANSFSLQQVFSIGINTIAPTSIITPSAQNITCSPPGQMVTFTSVATPTLNVSQSWTSPFSTGMYLSYTPTSLYSLAGTGVYTNCVTNLVNGCSICKTFTVVSSAAFPTLSITSPTQFSLGCSSTSITSINISNVLTFPVGSPVSFTVLPPSFVGPGYSLGGSPSYSANSPGQYVVIVKDNITSCETKIPISVIQNTVGPNMSVSVSTQTLSCFTPSALVQASSTNTGVTYSWSFPGPGTATTSALTVSTAPTGTFTGNYSLSVIGANSCASTTVIPFYQNKNAPTAVIIGSNSISCSTPSVNLTNASTSNVPGVFFPTQPVIGFAWYGPAPQASLALSSTYIAYTAGFYTLVAQDLNNGCKSTVTKSVVSTGVYPQISPSGPFNINCPVTTATIFPTMTGSTTGFTYLWAAPVTASVSSLNQPTITVNMPGDYTISVTNPINGCSTTSIITVAVCAGIGENLISGTNIDLFPNPTNGIINIGLSTLAQNVVVEIYSALGVLVKKQAITSQKSNINIQNEANGIYFIYVIEDKKAIKTAKIVKQ